MTGESPRASCEQRGALARRRVVILGASGSIGRQALEVVETLSDVSVVGLAARSSVGPVLAAAGRLGVGMVAFEESAAVAAAAARRSPCRVLAGAAGIAEMIAAAAADAAADEAEVTVLNGIVGAAGLRASLATLEAGATLALANKESLVAGGPFMVRAARRSGATILPVDSEHSAVFQCLEGGGREAAVEILLTGSGGPFRGRTRAELAEVTVDEALAHPNWVMGPKVTIDSATLMNKGLEVIEAHYLFGVPYDRIRVVVHPQSVVHSLVRFADGALLAHLGVPDMRTPIGYALDHPQRPSLPMVAALDLTSRELTFEEPDTATFGCLSLARAAGERAAAAWAGVTDEDDGGGGAGAAAPVVLNAANEIAVEAFLDGRLGFLDIERVVAGALERLGDGACGSLDDVFAIDGEARRVARGLCGGDG